LIFSDRCPGAALNLLRAHVVLLHGRVGGAPLLCLPLWIEFPRRDGFSDNFYGIVLAPGGCDVTIQAIDGPHGTGSRSQQSRDGDAFALHCLAIQRASKDSVAACELRRSRALVVRNSCESRSQVRAGVVGNDAQFTAQRTHDRVYIRVRILLARNVAANLKFRPVAEHVVPTFSKAGSREHLSGLRVDGNVRVAYSNANLAIGRHHRQAIADVRRAEAVGSANHLPSLWHSYIECPFVGIVPAHEIERGTAGRIGRGSGIFHGLVLYNVKTFQDADKCIGRVPVHIRGSLHAIQIGRGAARSNGPAQHGRSVALCGFRGGANYIRRSLRRGPRHLAIDTPGKLLQESSGPAAIKLLPLEENGPNHRSLSVLSLNHDLPARSLPGNTPVSGRFHGKPRGIIACGPSCGCSTWRIANESEKANHREKVAGRRWFSGSHVLRAIRANARPTLS